MSPDLTPDLASPATCRDEASVGALVLSLGTKDSRSLFRPFERAMRYLNPRQETLKNRLTRFLQGLFQCVFQERPSKQLSFKDLGTQLPQDIVDLSKRGMQEPDTTTFGESPIASRNSLRGSSTA